MLTASSANAEVTQARITLAIEIGAAVLALGFTLLLNRSLINRILQPLNALQRASQTTEKQINQLEDAQPQALEYRCELDQNSGQELLDLNVAVQSMVKAFNQLTQNLAAKEQQITRMFQEQRLQDEQALAQMNHRLKVSLEAAAIAHEINQPLSILRLTAQRLQHQLRERAEADDPAELLDALQILDDQASRIGTTDQMKAIIRNANTSLSRIDLRDVLDSIELYVKSNLIEASSWITTSLPSELKEQQAWVEGDAVQLQIAVINLVKMLWTPCRINLPPRLLRRSRFDSNAGNSIGRSLSTTTVPDCLTTTPVTCRFTAASLPAAAWDCSSCARRWRATTEN